MEHNRKNFRILINQAATDFSRSALGIEFEDAQWLIKSFVQYQNPISGHPKIVISEEGVESIRMKNIPKSLTFYEAAKLAVDLFGMATGNLFLSILGGLFLLRTLYDLSKIKLHLVDSLMIMALLNNRDGLTDEEWLKEIQKEEKFNIRVDRDFDLKKLIEHAEGLEKLNAIELLDGKWRFSDKVVFQ